MEAEQQLEQQQEPAPVAPCKRTPGCCHRFGHAGRCKVAGAGTRVADKEFACPECGETYNKQHRLDEHMRSHTGEVTSHSMLYPPPKLFARTS